MVLIIGAFLGFISVSFGAYAEHGLQDRLSVDSIRALDTAIRYNQLYAILISGIGLLIQTKVSQSRLLMISGHAFILGTVLFSGSIYLSTVLSKPYFSAIAPYGGTMLLLAWMLLLLVGVIAATAKKKSDAL